MGVVLVAIMIFIVGYLTGSINTNEVTKEIRIGYQNSNHLNRVDYYNIFTDVENPSIIERFLMIYINKEKTENVNVDEDNPDIYIEVNNPKASVGLIDSKLWFTDEGAIIGRRIGPDWGSMNFYNIDKGDAAYIKETIEYEQG